MDPINLGFYAVICGALSAASPAMGGLATRAGIGVVIGAVAAWALPVLKVALGLGQ